MTAPPIVILSGGCHEERWTTYQRVARELAREHPVLYVEGNYSVGKLFHGWSGRGPRSWRKPGLREIRPGFHVLTPPPRLPLRHHVGAIGVLNQAVLRRSVRGAMERLGLADVVLWSFLHQSGRILGRLGERLSVYHCVDYWPWLVPLVPTRGRAGRVRRDEAATAAAADFTVSTSRFLAARMAEHNPRSVYVPNAADLPPTAGGPMPPDLEAIPRPRIGFSGTLEAKTDVDLLASLAGARPDWRFVFIGHADNVRGVDRLTARPNVHFLGMKAPADVPAYLAGFDVCLVPFRKTPELESISPLKVFEYLAAGRPVVATDYGELADLRLVLHPAEGVDGFLAAIEAALADDGPDRRAARRAVAARNTWEERGRVLRELIRKALAEKNAPPADIRLSGGGRLPMFSI